MVSLNTTVARCRIFYPRPIPAMPDIVMIELPSEYRDASAPQEPFYSILIETTAEHDELEAYLADETLEPALPVLFDERPSGLAADHITVAHYGPPVEDWPYVLLCRWPRHLAAATPKDLRMFIREVYTIELFDDQDSLERASDTLLMLLKRRRRARVEIILPEWSSVPGKAPH